MGPGRLILFDSANANVSHSLGPLVSDGVSVIGNQYLSAGTVDVGANTTWTNNGDLYVGNSGSGGLWIYGTTSDVNGFLCADLTGNGYSQVNSVGQWASSSTLYIGYSGVGKIDDYGHLSSQDNVLGYNPGSGGTVSVVGSVSELQSTSNTIVGYGGNGTLNVMNGGHAIAETYTYLGFGDGSKGSVLVSGTGSILQSNSGTDVGFRGVGELTIQNGGLATASDFSLIGSLGDGQGTVTVDGVGSRFDVAS